MGIGSKAAAATASSSGEQGISPDNIPGAHLHRRYFIGPQPEQAVTRILDDSSRNLLRTHAIRAFLSFETHRNSSEYDLNDSDEPSRLRKKVIDEVWKQSKWGSYLTERKHSRHASATHHSQWIGESFRIGTIGQTGDDGFDFIQETEQDLRDRMSLLSNRASSNAKSMVSKLSAPAPPSIPDMPERSTSEPLMPSHSSHPESLLVPPTDTHSVSPTSSTHLLNHDSDYPPLSRIKSDPPGPIKMLSSSHAKSDVHLTSSIKRKGKHKVHYVDTPEESEISTPVPASQVLEREGAQVSQTSAGAAIRIPSVSPKSGNEDDVILRDRMLVRVSYTKREDLSPLFDEQQMRTSSDLQYEDWAEFLVVWRNNRIELYEDYSFRAQEWVRGHKHLSYAIPLTGKSAHNVHVSLFSFVDMTFCLTSPPMDPKSLRLFHREKRGTNIFVMKVKSRSRAMDWIWQLWRHLGGRIPTSIDLVSPVLESKVKVDIPELDREENEGALGSILSREKVISLCTAALMGHEEWKALVGYQITRGKELELAWRMDTTLDWIWLDSDTLGEPRPWVVICGIAFRQSDMSAQLEIRLGEHFPTSLNLDETERERHSQGSGGSTDSLQDSQPKRLQEPDSVEGYLDRIKPNSQVKQQLYLAVHDGHLFSINPKHAHPPQPPVPPPPGEDLTTFAYNFRKAEVSRGAHQLSHAHAACDLRNIVAVRRAFQPLTPFKHQDREPPQDDPRWASHWTEPEHPDAEDDNDDGGDEALEKHEDKTHVRMKRSFELLFKSGQIIRFETYSRKTAIEWINGLRSLIFYWKRRHLVDAREEMDLATTRRQRVTPRVRANRDDAKLAPEPPPDLSAPMPALGTLYNWCVLEGCKPILRGGKVYSRRGLRGQFKYIQLFLIRGELLRFRIDTRAPFSNVTSKKISLIDAYVCSGYFAAIAFPGQYKPNAPPTARRYQDGLEADDPDEDLIFALWYLSNGPKPEETIDSSCTVDMAQSEDEDGSATGSVPTLSAKRKVVIFRTRSKLERDAWCWAINSEIERLVRAQKGRETKLRMTGNLAPLSS